MSTCHYVEKQEKLMMQSRENGQKPKFGQFFDDFEVIYLQIANFSEKYVSFSTNFRPKTKKIVSRFWEKYQSVWFGANLENFSRTPPNEEFFFKNPALSLFYLYSPLTSCKKSKKSLEPFLRKLHYQPTNYYQQHRSYRASRTPVQKFKPLNYSCKTKVLKQL